MSNCCDRCKCEKEDNDKEECRNYIDYPEDNNCCLVSICKHENLTLEEVGERLDLSAPRIKQIEDEAIKKFRKNFLKALEVNLSEI